MKGVIISSGFSKRLWPINVIPKIIQPIYDKPAIYYQITNLINWGITDIAIVGTPYSNRLLEITLKDIPGLNVTFIDEQESEVQGTATSLLRAKRFIGADDFTVLLGDSLFVDLDNSISQSFINCKQSFTILVNVPDARPYAYFKDGHAVEKGDDALISKAIPGLHFLKNEAIKYLENVPKSERGEFEIISAVNEMLNENKFEVKSANESVIWIDVGDSESIMSASRLIQLIEALTGRVIGSPHLKIDSGIADTRSILDKLNIKKSNYASKIEREINQKYKEIT